MKNPPISFVVQTQFVTNSAGLRHLYRKKFTSDNIFEARRKAQEYYDSAVDLLMREGEIYLDENNKICYKNPQKYDGGIKLWLYVNRDFFHGKIADKAGQTYLLSGHFTPNSEEARKIKFGNMMLHWYLDEIESLKPLEIENFINDPDSKWYESAKELVRLRRMPPEKIECIKFNDEKYLEKILKTACAFLNSGDGIIILGQSHQLEQRSGRQRLLDDMNVAQFFLEMAFPKFMENIKLSVQSLCEIKFVKIQVAKSVMGAFYKDEYFVRTKNGNAVDRDKLRGNSVDL